MVVRVSRCHEAGRHAHTNNCGPFDSERIVRGGQELIPGRQERLVLVGGTQDSHYHDDDFYTRKTGEQFSLSFDQEAILKVAGHVVDTKTRALKVTVERWLGSGRFMDKFGGGTNVVNADERTQIFFSNNGWPSSLPKPVPHPTFVWELKPVSIEQQDLGPDQQREIVTYKGSRGIKPPVAMHVPGDGNEVTEHIEIRQAGS